MIYGIIILKICIFLKTASNANNENKTKYMTAFYNGVKLSSDDEVKIIHDAKYEKCDLAVIFGFYGKNMGDLQKFRKHIYKNQKENNKECIFIDADLFRFLGKKGELDKNNDNQNTFVRLSYKSIFFDKMFDPNYDEYSDERWNIISSTKKIKLSEYKNNGRHILICLNSSPNHGYGWSAGNLDVYKWADNKIKEIRKYSNRPIILRFHPNAKDEVKSSIPISLFASNKDIYYSGGIIPGKPIHSRLSNDRNIIKNTSLIDDCKDAWCAVAYNTSSIITPMIYGIPTFSSEKSCPIYSISNNDIKNINTPKLFDRTKWLNEISYSLWNHNEINNGDMWKYYRKFVLFE